MSPPIQQHNPSTYAAHAGYLQLGPEAQRKAFIRSGLVAMGYRRDSAEGVTLSRQLEAMWATSYRVKRTPLMGRQLVPRDTNTPPWAEGYRYRVYDHVGAAVLLKTYRERLPRVSAVAAERFGRVWGYGTSIGWTEMERMQSAATGTNLPTEEQTAAERVLEERVDDSIAFGEPELDTTGLLNNPNVPVVVLPAGAASSVYWPSKTPREILDDLDLIFETVRSQSAQTESMTTLVLPPRARAYIASRAWSDHSDVSILEYWQEAHPGVEVVAEWIKCNTAGAGGTARAVAYAQTPEHLRAIIPLEFTLMPLERSGFEYGAPAHVRVGGVQWLFPMSGVYADGFFNPALL